MKVHTWEVAMATPVVSLAAVVIVAVNSELLSRLFVGVNVAVFPEYVTDPGTDAPLCVRVKVLAVMVDASMGSLKVALIVLDSATFPLPLAGVV
jgi:hypothetical protein